MSGYNGGDPSNPDPYQDGPGGYDPEEHDSHIAFQAHRRLNFARTALPLRVPGPI